MNKVMIVLRSPPCTRSHHLPPSFIASQCSRVKSVRSTARSTPQEAPWKKILSVHMIFSLRYLATGFSGAELANVVNEAALLAGRQAKNAVEVGELVEGVQRTK